MDHGSTRWPGAERGIRDVGAEARQQLQEGLAGVKYIGAAGNEGVRERFVRRRASEEVRRDKSAYMHDWVMPRCEEHTVTV